MRSPMRNRNANLKSLLQKKSLIEKEANKIIKRNPSLTWQQDQRKKDVLDDFESPMAGKIIVGGGMGCMYGFIGGAIAGSYSSSTVVVGSSAVIGAALGIYCCMEAMSEAPCSPFKDCNRLEKLDKEFKGIKDQIKKTVVQSPTMQRA
jgi:hypothetical protein